LARDVGPDVELGPVRQGEDADALARIEAAVVEVPELGPLAARIPAMAGAAQRENPLLGARRLLVSARPADRGIEAMEIERLLQRRGLHDVGVDRRAMAERADAARQPLAVDVDQQRQAELLHAPVAEGD